MGEVLGISRSSLDRWRRRQEKPAADASRSGRPNVIPEAAQHRLRECYADHYYQWGPRVLADWARREGLGNWSPGTIAKVIADLKPEPPPKQPPERYEVLGDAEGKECGHLLVTYSSLYNLVPIGMDTKLERAHAAALASVPGATGLVNVIVSESYFTYLLGNAHCVKIQGQAIR